MDTELADAAAQMADTAAGAAEALYALAETDCVRPEALRLLARQLELDAGTLAGLVGE